MIVIFFMNKENRLTVQIPLLNQSKFKISWGNIKVSGSNAK